MRTEAAVTNGNGIIGFHKFPGRSVPWIWNPWCRKEPSNQCQNPVADHKEYPQTSNHFLRICSDKYKLRGHNHMSFPLKGGWQNGVQ